MPVLLTHLILVSCLSALARPMQDGPNASAPKPAVPAVPAAKAATPKDRLLQEGGDESARVQAAVELLAADVVFVRAQLAQSTREDVLKALLDAAVLQAGVRAEVTALVPDIVGVASRKDIGQAAARARDAVVELHRAARAAVLPQIVALLDDSDPERVRVAADLLGTFRDVDAIAALVRLLRRTNGEGPLAKVAGAALESITLYPLGTNVKAWSQFLEQNGGKPRDRILEEALQRERVEKDEHLRLAESEIVRLKSEAAEIDPRRMIADLTYPLAQVRLNAAQGLLARGGDIELSAAREPILAGLETNVEAADIVVAFLRLLAAIDERTDGPNPTDDRRDLMLAQLIADARPPVAIAAAETAGHFPGPHAAEAVLATLRRLQSVVEPSDVRTALLKVTGKLNLVAAKDLLIAALRRDPAVDARIAAATNLGVLRCAEAREDIEHALANDAEWRVRRRAAKPLAQVAGAAAVPALAAALADPKAEVRTAAVEELAGLKTDGALDALLARLSVEDVIRAELVKALGAAGDPRAIPAVAVQLVRSAPERLEPPLPDEEPIWRDARASLAALCGDDVALWTHVCTAALGVDKPQLHAWAFTQIVRAYEAHDVTDPAALLTALLQQARALNRNLQWDEALAALDDAEARAGTAATPNDRMALARERARAHGGAGHVPEAKDAWNKALAAARDTSADVARACATEAARAFFDAGDAQACESALAAVEGLADEDALLLARARRRLGRGDVAIVGLRDLLARPTVTESPVEVHARFELVEALLEANDAAGALAELDRVDERLARTNDQASALRSQDLRAKALALQATKTAGEPRKQMPRPRRG